MISLAPGVQSISLLICLIAMGLAAVFALVSLVCELCDKERATLIFLTLAIGGLALALLCVVVSAIHGIYFGGWFMAH